MQALIVIYTVVGPLIFNTDGEKVQKSVVPGLIAMATIELSLKGIDSLDCRVTRCDSCASSSNDSKPFPVSSPSNPLYMTSFGNEFSALHSVAQNVAKNRHSSVIGRQGRLRALRGIIEMEKCLRMLGSSLRSYAGPRQTSLVTGRRMGTSCRDASKETG